MLDCHTGIDKETESPGFHGKLKVLKIVFMRGFCAFQFLMQSKETSVLVIL